MSGFGNLRSEPMLARRLVQLYLGLLLYGTSMALMIEAELGLDPWDVLHQGLSRLTGLSFGWVVIGAGAVVLLLWIPLRQRPGLGTVSNVIVIRPGGRRRAGGAPHARSDAGPGQGWSPPQPADWPFPRSGSGSHNGDQEGVECGLRSVHDASSAGCTVPTGYGRSGTSRLG